MPRGMLDLRFVTDDLAGLRAGLARRGFRDAAALDALAAAAAERRSLIAETEALRARRNEVSKELGSVKDKKSAEFERAREAMRHVGEQIKALDARLGDVETRVNDALLRLPNLPASSAPDGLDESGNVVVRSWGEPPRFDFEPKDHVDIGLGLGILDFERAAKVSGARFSVLRGMGARLERGLISFMLDLHSAEHGYTEVWTPVLVKDSALRGTGQLPKFAADVFRIASDESWQQHSEEKRDLYLIPTAEVSVTNLHAEEILDGADLPFGYAAYTACFRSEAGSYGKDTRGLIRQHQFDKVELVRFCHAEEGEGELEKLTGHAEEVLQRLGLAYRVSQLCAGDMGFAAQKAYDIEVWLPGQNAYREISSCSWFGEFQARRAKIRLRREAKGKPELAHTLNGSGLAVGRTLVAILEQCQREDGSVVVPEALRAYVGGVPVIERS